MRVLVTGSRIFPDPQLVWWALDQTLGLAERCDDKLTVVHGDNPKGADADAKAWVHMRKMEGRPVEEQPCPAEWDLCTPDCRHPETRRAGRVYCPVAGLRRNQLMVDAGADYCLAFVARCPCPDRRRNDATGMHGTHGTVDCLDKAAAAGIAVKPFRPRSKP
jgi:hypothetical protein